MYMRTGTPKSSLFAMIVFGLAFLAAAVALFFTDQIPSSWVKEQGTISSYTVNNEGNKGTTYCAVITYRVHNQSYTTRSNDCGGMPTVGAPAQVAYNPASPSNAKAIGGFTDAFLIAVCGLAGLALLIYAPINYNKTKGQVGGGPSSVFTTQWPHVPNQVVTTTLPPTSSRATTTPDPVQPAQPVAPPPPAPANPSDDPSQPPDLNNPPT